MNIWHSIDRILILFGWARSFISFSARQTAPQTLVAMLVDRRGKVSAKCFIPQTTETQWSFQEVQNTFIAVRLWSAVKLRLK